ncbi:hypothetical protein MTO96_037485 [Rhipicephalus appendiculatus]
MTLQCRNLPHLERLIQELSDYRLSDSTPCPGMSKTWTYTLTGFTDSLERRRLVFLEPLPDSRVCAACGVVPFQASLLPCGHVFCRFCEDQIREGATCPVDRYKYDEENVLQSNFPLEDLEQRRVLCGVVGEKCDFVGTVSDMECHLVECVADENECARCRRPVARRDAVDHCWHCTASFPVMWLGLTATDVVPSSIFEKLNAFKEGVLRVREQWTSSDDSEDGSSDGVDMTAPLVDGVVQLVRELLPVGRVPRCPDRVSTPSDSANVPWASGPYRGASKAGVSVATCALEEVSACWDLFSEQDKNVNITSNQCTAAGYTFRMRAHLVNDKSEGVRVHFVFFLVSGEWDDHVSWPFAKELTLTLAHPVDASRDVKLSGIVAEEDSASKPIPCTPNNGYKTDGIEWSLILKHGYIAKDKIYVNVELE